MKKTFLLIIPFILIFAGCTLWEKAEDQNENVNSQEAVEINLNQEVEVQAVNEELSESENSDWVTYKNDEYRFNLKYPPEYEISEYNNSSENKKFEILFSKENGPQPSFWVSENGSEQVIEEIYNADPVSEIISEEQGIVGNNNVTIIKQKAAIGGIATYYIFSNEKTYIFQELDIDSGIVNTIELNK
ncbi:hypothetical protein KKC88_00290 [Patescibacteria group bacterium]|nr:hypothetical protein [Patescibacteria group bacterium]MBU1673425.1 hypothetical protein [Patescibacteria group bacterium]MBU1963374.1 hypothetical protein [Patescibacteria group bacterium]